MQFNCPEFRARHSSSVAAGSRSSAGVLSRVLESAISSHVVALAAGATWWTYDDRGARSDGRRDIRRREISAAAVGLRPESAEAAVVLPAGGPAALGHRVEDITLRVELTRIELTIETVLS